VTAATPYSGQFDINPALATALFTQPYDIVSATMTFFFSDDAQDGKTQTGTTQSDGSPQWRSSTGCGYYTSYCYQYYDVNHYVTRYWYEDGETAFVSTSGDSSSASSTYQGTNVSTGPFNPTGQSQQSFPYTYHYTYSYSCGSFGWSTCTGTGTAAGTGINYYNHYLQYTDSTQMYGGNWSLSDALSTGSIADLAADGLLNFTIKGSGDFFFNSAALTLNINQNPAPPPVPEPATMTMLGTGLVGMAARQWRKRRRGRATA